MKKIIITFLLILLSTKSSQSGKEDFSDEDQTSLEKALPEIKRRLGNCLENQKKFSIQLSELFQLLNPMISPQQIELIVTSFSGDIQTKIEETLSLVTIYEILGPDIESSEDEEDVMDID